MKDRKKILRVESRAQKILFEMELLGQISDGHWENATPHDHYKAFTGVEVVVAVGNETPGANFHPRRRYDFANGDLLECVGQRMLAYVRLEMAFSQEEVEILESLGGLDWEKVEMPTYPGEYYDKKRVQIQEILEKNNQTLANVQRIAKDETVYSWKQLIRDLNALKRAIQTNIEINA